MAITITLAGVTYGTGGNDIIQGPNPTMTESVNLTGSGLAWDTLELRLRYNGDRTDIEALTFGEELDVYVDSVFERRYYLSSVTNLKKVAANLYTFTVEATSAVGLLAASEHRGGFYSSTAAGTIIADIMGDIDYVCDPVIEAVVVNGVLPWDSRRNNLQKVLFATGSSVRKNDLGQVSIEYAQPTTATPIGPERQIIGAAFVDFARASKISLTEHLFFVDAAGQEETIFDNSTEPSAGGTVIKFEKPMQALRVTGLTLDDSGVNFAIVSGNGVLYGVPYGHSERVITEATGVSGEDSELSINDQTLVSSVNSGAVMDRLINYQLNARKVALPFYSAGERCGDIIMFKDPYGDQKTGYIEDSVEVLSGINRMASTVVTNWIPTTPGNNYDLSIIITEDNLSGGRYYVPSALQGTEAQVVLFSGAQGGQGGWYGESKGRLDGSGRRGAVIDAGDDVYVGGASPIQYGGAGGPGGQGGASAARIRIFDINSLGASYAVSFGAGGQGGSGGTIVRDAKYAETKTDPQTGSAGADSTWGSYSTSAGGAFEGYYVDMVTGDIITQPGEIGLSGGAGGDGGPSNYYTKYTTSFDYSAIGRGGNGHAAEDGSPGGAGADGANGTNFTASSYNADRLPAGKYYLANAGGGGGGGGAAGGTAGAGTSGGSGYRTWPDHELYYVGRNYAGPNDWHYYSPVGGDGANAVTVPGQTLGRGGRGGAGGGGGGGSGQALGSETANAGSYTNWLGESMGGKGGNGGQGGQGSNGFALMYLKAADLLPAGYTALQYISGSDRNGPRIDTGVNDDVIVTLEGVADETNYNQVWVTRGATGSHASWHGVVYTNHKWGGDTGANDSVDIAGTTKAVSKVAITSSGITATVNGLTYSIAGTVTVGEVTLFNPKNLNNYGAQGKLYRASMTLNGRTVWCGIPAKNSSNVAGLYDVIGGTFYSSASSTPFTAGPEA